MQSMSERATIHKRVWAQGRSEGDGEGEGEGRGEGQAPGVAGLVGPAPAGCTRLTLICAAPKGVKGGVPSTPAPAAHDVRIRCALT